MTTKRSYVRARRFAEIAPSIAARLAFGTGFARLGFAPFPFG
jgi:hypothetical protein